MSPYLQGKIIVVLILTLCSEDTHMVVRLDATKSQRRHRRRKRAAAVQCSLSAIRKITGATPHGYVEEHLTPFGGVLPLEKLLDALEVESAFAEHFVEPARAPVRGHWRMVKGMINLQFIGLTRLYHFTYVKDDAMVKGILHMSKLPAVSTFWRCLNSYGLEQDRSLLKLNAVLRERAWRSLGYDTQHHHLHVDLDTTVKTVYGDKEGARKGHNRQHRGKKGLRPVVAFIAETKEYLAGMQREGKTLSGAEAKNFLHTIRRLLPPSVKKVTLRADSEFFSWKAVQQARALGFDYIIAVKKTQPQFNENEWYSVGDDKTIQYNSTVYKPPSWPSACRFVGMRIRKDPNDPKNRQLPIFEDDNYRYRVFATSREAAAHRVVAEYDDRAGAEKLISEMHHEGIAAIPSKHFAPNGAFLQIAMLTYNLWRHVKAFANRSPQEDTWSRNTNRVSRLRLLWLAAKVNYHGEQTQIKYSAFLPVRPTLENLFCRLDHLRDDRCVWKSPVPALASRYLRPREQDRIVHKILCTSSA
jgi:hypothetical protein